MTTEQLQDKCRGSFVGGAVGDALGYAVEFLSVADDLTGITSREQVNERYINHRPFNVDSHEFL